MTKLDRINQCIKYYEGYIKSDEPLYGDTLQVIRKYLSILEEMKRSDKETPIRFIMWKYGKNELTAGQSDELMEWF